MAKVTIDLPEGAFSALRRSPQEFVKEMRIAVILRAKRKGVIGSAATWPYNSAGRLN